MQHKLISLFISTAVSLFFIFVSCNKDIEPKSDFSNDYSETEILTKAEESVFQVNFSDVEWLIQVLYPEAGPFVIEAYPDKGAPLLYAVNFDEGWKIISGDKRTSPILAYSDSSHINLMEIDNTGLRSWLYGMGELINSIEGVDLDNESFLRFWDTTFDLVRKGKNIETKAGDLWYRQLVDEFVTSYSVSTSSAFVGVSWGQNAPWNIRTPIYSGLRCPTGCVAVALAQIFRYLHYSINVPNALFHSVGYDNTNIFHRSDSVANSPRWNNMAQSINSGVGSTEYVADLMVDIGNRVNMNYTPGISTSDIYYAQDALQYYGLIGSVANYSYSLVKQDLIAHRPVYMRGGDVLDADGHAWVCDGYNEVGTITHRIYIWHEVYNGYSGETFTAAQAQATLDEGVILSEGVGYLEDTNNPIQNFLHMNWGNDGSYDGWYYYPNEWPNTDESYPYNAMILYNIHALD